MGDRVIHWQSGLLGVVAVLGLIGDGWGQEPMKGQVLWAEPSYQITDAGVIGVTDSDQDQNPNQPETVSVAIWSDSDGGGFTLILAETGLATGVFEGIVGFTSNESSGNSLKVANGDTVTAEYLDPIIPVGPNTFYSTTITGTTIIGTIVPPLERAPVANGRKVDAYGEPLPSGTSETIQPWYQPPSTIRPVYKPPPEPAAQQDVETKVRTIRRK